MRVPRRNNLIKTEVVRLRKITAVTERVVQRFRALRNAVANGGDLQPYGALPISSDTANEKSRRAR